MKTMITIALALLVGSAFAQNNFGTIKGKVLDSITGQPIFSARVWVMSNGSPIGGATNFDGEYTIKPLPAGTYDVNIKSIEYGTTTLVGVIVKSDQIAFADDIAMTEGNMMEGVVIQGNTLINPEETKLISIGSKEIARLPVRTSVNGILQTMSSELKVSDDGKQVYFRGARNGDVIYMVDGVKIQGSAPSLPSSGIGRMSVYTGGVPAKYGDTMGGVVVIETKSYFDMYYESLRNQ
ncbi:MAG: hypothetical protein ACI9N1_001703 [Flavobacteriales bacterium]|jgi:hypothetical protein